jgi:hypothetical protein
MKNKLPTSFTQKTYPLIKVFFSCAGLLSWIFLFSYGCNPDLNKEIQSEVDSIRSIWVPDTREAICSVTVKEGEKGVIILSGETTIPQAKENIIKALSKPGISFIDSILILPDSSQNKNYHGLVTLRVINLRKAPDHQAERVSQAILGTPVLMLRNQGGWLLIQTPDRYIAWTERSSVKLLNSLEIADWKNSERIIYKENSGWVYTTPDESGIVGDLVAGSILKKSGESHGFVRVVFPDGREGYIRKEKVLNFESWRKNVLCNEDNVISIASTFLGLPYLWGGSSSKAVDCSGLVQSVYFMNGLILSRDASLQALHGIPVDISAGFSQLRKGDLLFFGSSRVTHVAVYKGDGEYIHSSGRVMINSLDSTRSNYSSYRKNSFLSVRRIIGAENDNGIVPVYRHDWY